ncbi:MAG TPA: DEAD/DEAH box helicase [Gemmataceae bacterium]|nr:DEAD/DEAH box helicase [Gemmataceae bacterium]
MSNAPADLHFADQPPPAAAALASLAAPAAEWFASRFGEPTAAQRLAWPLLAAGGHVLVSAPTGTGKTLAAFLPILGQLAARPPAEGASVACLYVAPLKALANDAARNLQAHVAELAPLLPPGAAPRVAVRTGDTPAAERRRQRQAPPAVLCTTPESLAVLLSQPALVGLFAGLRWVVVDEVHSLAGNKRGADLSLSLERLTALADAPPQRVGLSATATPLADAAAWLAGVGRPCAVARAAAGDPPELTIAPLTDQSRFLAALVGRLLPEVRDRRATLVFANTRRLAEQLAWALRLHLPEWEAQIAAHHSALAAARRREVEEQFKQGRLRVVVSTTSLELGIDVGSIDLAVLVHPPGDVVRLLQCVGRSGHGPGGVKRGLVLTASEVELLEAAVTAASGRAGQCEPLRVAGHPLDVLCQQILGMAAVREWSADAMFELARRATPYRDLPRRDFDDCLAYLLGLDRDRRPWLPPRLQGEPASFAILDERTTRLLRRNLGTILAEESVPVRLRPREEESPAPEVGSVDEAFADRLQPGDRFLLDGRCLEVRTRRPDALLVDEVVGRASVPRWAGEGWPLSTELARRLYLLRVQAAEALRDGPEALAGLLQRDYRLVGEAAAVLADYFQRQESLSEVPDTAAGLVEGVVTGDGVDYYVHTPLNRLGNDALARVAVHRLARDHARAATSLVADLGFALRTRGGADGMPDLLRSLLAADDFDADLGAALAGSVPLRQRFGRVALTGLMLLRNPLGRRRRVGGPGWGERQLYDRVQAHDPEFVLLRQAGREVRADLCDADAARSYAAEVAALPLRLRWLPHVSPFVESWTQLGRGPAETVETAAEALQRLHAALMREGEA